MSMGFGTIWYEEGIEEHALASKVCYRSVLLQHLKGPSQPLTMVAPANAFSGEAGRYPHLGLLTGCRSHKRRSMLLPQACLLCDRRLLFCAEVVPCSLCRWS